jgi:hypothetical protein
LGRSSEVFTTTSTPTETWGARERLSVFREGRGGGVGALFVLVGPDMGIDWGSPPASR